ncbi:hydrolase [Bdellovibrio sp. ArHS]|uniref:ComEC/Rec2 family competence protein n=1 Tax=Bdellovibrio sp. ArHS TaxID=1569284 RepID=UPI000A475B47|nr:hydrolase [Bdellovibrio sp. ArHS]
MKYLVFLLVFASPSLNRDIPARSYFVVWNVGQGQWLTAITPASCHHFDMGGEFFPWQKIIFQCAQKENFVFLSHWDWDHIGALNQFKNMTRLQKLCIQLRPRGKTSGRKARLLSSYLDCPVQFKGAVWSTQSPRNTNEQSHVIAFNSYLIPGDSTSAQEKKWSTLSAFRQARVLILGHHGSQTSTSKELLDSLPALRMSVASARWARYRHPHSQVQWRLQKKKVPLLRTEDWGNIWFE